MKRIIIYNAFQEPSSLQLIDQTLCFFPKVDAHWLVYSATSNSPELIAEVHSEKVLNSQSQTTFTYYPALGTAEECFALLQSDKPDALIICASRKFWLSFIKLLRNQNPVFETFHFRDICCTEYIESIYDSLKNKSSLAKEVLISSDPAIYSGKQHGTFKIVEPLPFFSSQINQYKQFYTDSMDLCLIPLQMLSAWEGIFKLGNAPCPIYFSTPEFWLTSDNQNVVLNLQLIFHESVKQLAIATYLWNYSTFATIYDDYMEDVTYQFWVQLVLKLYQKHTDLALNTIHELACGTGTIASYLQNKGFQVSGSDLSPDMLRLAYQKNKNLCLFQGDMTSLIPLTDLHLILLMFDSINYLSDYEQIAQLLFHAAKALHPEGLFIFDISTYSNCIENFDQFINTTEKPDYYFIHTSDYDQFKNKQITQLQIFSKHNHLFKRYSETHNQSVFYTRQIKKNHRAITF